MVRFLLVSMLLFSRLAAAQESEITVCHTSSTERFALLASTAAFQSEHPLPLAYRHVSQQGGKMTSFKCPDGTDASGYMLQAKEKTRNWIFVFQEWWGLNDNIKRHAEEIYTSLGNVNVIALDMYDGKLAQDPATASKLVQQFTQDRGDMIVRGALAYAGSDAVIGTVGYCFGGTQSLLAALMAGKQAKACVIYYGMPVNDVGKLKTLHADVLGIFAAREKRITPEVVRQFETDMKAAGKKLIVKNYDAEHGFANPSNPVHNKEATEDAYKHTIAFFKERIR